MTLSRTIARRNYNNALSIQDIETLIRSYNPSMYLPLNDTSADTWGANGLARNTIYNGGVGAGLLTNSDFSAWTADNPDDWTVLNENGTTRLVEENANGARFLDTDSSTTTVQTRQGALTLGDTYRFNTNIYSITTGTLLAGVNEAGGNKSYTTPGEKTFQWIPQIANVPLIQTNPTTADADGVVRSSQVQKTGELDGLYTGPTLNNDTFVNQPCPTFDGSNDYVQLEHNRLETVFDPDIGSMGIALKLTTAQWQDASLYWAMVIGEGSSNRFMIYKVAANTLRFQVHVGAAALSAAYTVVSGDYDKWLYPVCTWNSSQNRFNLYVKTDNVSQTYPVGTWTTNDLTANFCQIGANNTGNFWPGSLSSGFLTNQELSGNDALEIYNTLLALEPEMA